MVLGANQLSMIAVMYEALGTQETENCKSGQLDHNSKVCPLLHECNSNNGEGEANKSEW